MNHVFVDFENVHQVDLTLIGAKGVSFTLMVGVKQTKLDTDLVEKLMEHSASVRLVKLKSSGRNALDFALAYYLGRAVLVDPTAYFHLISKDGGFDPLIEHLRERHIHVRRHVSCAELTFTWPGKTPPVGDSVAKPVARKVAKKAAAKKVAKKVATTKVAKEAVVKKGDPVDEWLERVVKNLRDHPKARPVKKKTLLAKVGDLIKKPVGGSEVQAVIDRLVKAGNLKFGEKDRPEYSF
ncbi:MAG: NYN domain-containing protein [Verrucomicrobiales bacterium]|nr:NYN domain-containing protein [Verrucomicrobiales bacterium]